MDWTSPISSTISGAFGLIGQGLQYKYNKKLQEQQNQFNLDMWNLQNAYNSPQAQMKRYEEAGLNPALIYSQGNPGNAASAPVQGVPEAPEFSKDMRELSQAFNIEGLKTAIANRKKAEADARQSKAAADDLESDNLALSDLYWNYHFEPSTGKFVYDGGISGQNGDNYFAKTVYPLVGRMSEGKAMRILADNFRTNALLVPRAALIGSQNQLNSKRIDFLAPQIRAAEFNSTPWRMKTNFWIGNVKTGAQALNNLFF